MPRLVLFAVLTALVAALGCSSDDTPGTGGNGGSVEPGGNGGGGAGGSGPSFAIAYCDARRTAVCDTIARCYPGAVVGECELKAPVSFGYDLCVSDAGATAGRVAAGFAALDDVAAQKCLDDILDPSTCPGDLFAQQATLNGTFPCLASSFSTGTVQTGGRCTVGADCAAGTFCDILLGDCFGFCTEFATEGQACTSPEARGCGTHRCGPGLTCSAPVKAGGCGKCAPGEGSASLPGEGEECVLQWVDFFCQEGLTCHTDPGLMGPFTCVPRGKEGATCIQSWECDFGLLCGNYDAGTQLGACMKPIATGQPCSNVFTNDVIFPSNPCEAGSACLKGEDGTSLVCTKLPGLLGKCGTDENIPCNEGICLAPHGAEFGSCREPTQEGESCGDILSQSCGAGLRCVQPGGTGQVKCLGPQPDGSVCADPIDCASGRCVGLPEKQRTCIAADFVCP